MAMTQKDWSSLQPAGRVLPRDMKLAIDYMRENIGQQICMADIVAAAGAPERTLRKHFLLFFRLAPLRFFRRLRLAAARDALLATPWRQRYRYRLTLWLCAFWAFLTRLPMLLRRTALCDPPPGSIP